MVNCRFSDDAARREATPVDNLFIAEYLPHASGLQVQVYLYGLMQCRYPSMGERPIDEALGLSEQAVRDAFAYWQSLGLVRIASDVPLTVEYRPLGEAAAQALPAKYAGLVRRIGALVAPRQFGVQELRHVYDWIEVYGLEEGAVLELIGHCMERKGRRVSVNYMTRVAQTWAERGVRTFEDAQAAVAADDLSRHGASAVLRAWNRRRRPTEDELALYDKWTRQWGFSDEAILAALPRLTATGSPNFTYLDELLDSMRGRQLTEKERIEADDEQTASDRAFASAVRARRQGGAGHAHAARADRAVPARVRHAAGAAALCGRLQPRRERAVRPHEAPAQRLARAGRFHRGAGRGAHGRAGEGAPRAAARERDGIRPAPGGRGGAQPPDPGSERGPLSAARQAQEARLPW